jgi:general stress protein 26
MPRTKRLPLRSNTTGRADPKSREAESREPKASRPQMPKDYGMADAKNGKGLLPWSHVGERMERSRNYWICTTRPDGRPHVMPVWGVWVEDRFYFGTDRRSRKARNLASNPVMAVHLESGDDVIIVEGPAEEVTDRTVLGQIDKGYAKKYKMGLSGHPGDTVIYGLKPRVAFAWREQDFNLSATRWAFDE